MAKIQSGITALYERLSRDDDQFGDSTSIVNQKQMLEDYAKSNGYNNIKHYTDDGYSGGSFDRPGWKKLIEDIEAGKISTVIAKDMSRIGRNYLEVGYYTEIFFGQKNIRFIAIANNVDSDNQGSSEFAPFLNIMNEWYLRDCSKKIKASKKSLGNSGFHLSGTPCYGYKKDPNDKRKWIVDEEAAEIVRLIYKLCIEGKGTTQIATYLQNHKIESPAYHAARNGTGKYKNNIEALEPYNWNSASVREILSRPEYIGCTVNFRTTSKSYKEKKNLYNSPDKWAVFEGTQEPIVDDYTYQLAQKLIKTPRRFNAIGEANPLTGLVFCADCGAKMYNHRARAFTNRHGKNIPAFDAYDCSTYKLSYSKSKETECKSHYISTKALNEIVLYTIKTVCKYAIEDRASFVDKVKKETETRNLQAAEEAKKKYQADLKRYDEVNKLYTKLYESFAMEIIPEDKFKMLSEAYEKEQMKLQKEIRTYEEELVSTKDAVDDIERFYELVDKFTSFEELTTQMLNEFVDKIIVHKAEKIDKRRVQEVEIYLNYIGKIDFLEPEEINPEQEAIDKYWRDKYWRTKEYELNRRKKETAEANKVIEAKEKAERERIIEELNAEIEALGIENMPVIPERLMSNSQNV